jgi:hypothetical protein
VIFACVPHTYKLSLHLEKLPQLRSKPLVPPTVVAREHVALDVPESPPIGCLLAHGQRRLNVQAEVFVVPGFIQQAIHAVGIAMVDDTSPPLNMLLHHRLMLLIPP